MTRGKILDIKEGISQSERWFKSLVPEYVSIDSRKIPDFVKFISDLSEQIHYFNLDNKPDGTWNDIFTNDSTLLAILVSRFNIRDLLNDFEQKKNNIIFSNNDEEAIDALKKTVHLIFDFANSLNKIHKSFDSIPLDKKIPEINVSIKDIEKEILLLKHYHQKNKNAYGFSEELDFSIFKLSPSSNEYVTKDDDNTNYTSDKSKIVAELSALVKIFENLKNKLIILIERTNHYINEEELTKKKYNPSIALFITFLDLYEHLRVQINGITRKHLDFYFKEILGIEFQNAAPDSVHLFFEPELDFKNISLTSNDLLIAEIPYREDLIEYKLDYDFVVTNAEVVEINRIELIEKDDVHVLKSKLEVIKPFDFQKKHIHSVESEEDLNELSNQPPVRENADVGIIIASPILYQTEGERLFELTIAFKENLNFSQKSDFYKIFSSAFVMEYTSPIGWELVKKYSINSDMLNENCNSVNVIKIIFKLLPSDKPIDVYNASIHKLKCFSEFPMLKILLNNFVHNNAYSNLCESIIENITINVKVKGYQALKIQNNIGPLSPLVPFQPFGPQPSLGSYLDIKNTNVFNKYTKSFSVNLDWHDLPKNKRGFTSYYEGYGSDFTNTSFKIKLSSIHNGIIKPENYLQQEFEMFEMNSGINELSSAKKIENIDYQKLKFLNNANLSNEMLDANPFFKEGTIRMELSSPQEAFGHKLYPHIFSKALISKKKKDKNKPLSNQPHTPIIKSISIDYELEYSEFFKLIPNKEALNIQLFHQHPFGYQTIFPDNLLKNIGFIPKISTKNNFHIALKNIEPSSILSLYVHIEEKNIHHTEHDIMNKPTIIWSYLDSNSWTTIIARDVLSDYTNNFTNSGIVTIKMPEKICKNNTIFSEDLFWIRASIDVPEDIQANVITVATNACTVSRVIKIKDENNTSILRLEPGLIKGFIFNKVGIQNVWQPFQSFGGKPHEFDGEYHMRVSERLRHKQRAVQSRDIVQLILQKFPQIMLVKCFCPEVANEIIIHDANLHIVLIPKEHYNGGFLNDQPKVSIYNLIKVKDFIQKEVPSFVKIEVGNPIYEKVKVICDVSFFEIEGKDIGKCIRNLNEEINKFISPWRYASDVEIKFERSLESQNLLRYIKNLPYVDTVSEFSIVHFFKSKNIDTNQLDAEIVDTAREGIKDIVGSTLASVLIPSSMHVINVVKRENSIAKTNKEKIKQKKKGTGIGDFIIGEEFLISKKYEHQIIDLKETKNDVDYDEELFTFIITHNI